MKRYLLLLLVFVALSAPAQSVSKAVVYKRFFKVGTSAGLLSSISHPENIHGVDTSNVNQANILSAADFTQLLTSAGRKKHRPMKIEGVQFAGQLFIDGRPHAYLYCGPTLLIDLTAGISYLLDPAYASIFDARSKALPLPK